MSLQLTGSDWHGSPFVTLNQGATSFPKWGPFGGSSSRIGSGSPPPGFNGERQDPLTGVTHLGNGYRAYSPALCRFTCPDSESPFGVGGINPYAYCNNDPINQTDPSGHGPLIWMVRQLLKIGVRIGLHEAVSEGVASAMVTTGYIETGVEFASSAATGIASESLAKSDPEMSAKLGWASLGLGLAASLGPIADLASRTRQGLKKLSGSERRVVLKGTMRDLRPYSDAAYIYEDDYRGGRRLNVVAHGTIENGRSYLSVSKNEDELLDAPELYRHLDANYTLSDFNSIRILSCYGGEGENSFAYRLYRESNMHIQAFSGTVSAVYEPKALREFIDEDIAAGLFARTRADFAARGVHRVDKTNPYSFLWSPIKYWTFNYHPVHFDPADEPVMRNWPRA